MIWPSILSLNNPGFLLFFSVCSSKAPNPLWWSSL
jgi:hypothetical protein